MAKLYFHYSTMNAGKSTALLQASHNYREGGMATYLLTAQFDTRAGEGRVVVKTTEGEISLSWSDFLVNDIITIYREDIKRYTNEADKSRRHEAAVSFQWLGGERDAAKQAAEILGGNSPDFKQRWTNWMKALKSL